MSPIELLINQRVSALTLEERASTLFSVCVPYNKGKVLVV